MSTVTAEEIIRRYGEGHRCFRGVDLDETAGILRGVDLSGADFSDSFIVADFTGAILKATLFRGANVKTCAFDGCDLSDADFRGSLICAATFKAATMTGALFEGATYHSYIYAAGETPQE